MQPPFIGSASGSASFVAFGGRLLAASSGGSTAATICRALLVQSQERRNAENLAEAVPVSARALQRFLTDARWDDERVISWLQAYLGPRLQHPQAVWVLDGSDFPKQGLKSVGGARQYCDILGKIANCQAGLFLAHVGSQGPARVDKRLYLPQAWHAAPPPLPQAGRGRPRRPPAHNLARARQQHRTETLRFLTDPAVPFTHNQAEQDLRMMKTRPKISGGFRTLRGAADFALLRSVATTARKQGWNRYTIGLRTPAELAAALDQALQTDLQRAPT